jgi:hypothetical protein
MRFKLSLVLVAILPVGALAPACTGSGTSTIGQHITCETEPGTGVILSCEPGDGSGSGTCEDVDTDGDGEPHDEGTPTPIARTADGGGGSDDGSDHEQGDSDDDGIPDSEDCDEHPGEDGDADADLPYDVKPQLGATTNPVVDAFMEKSGAVPASFTVDMNGASWRATEIQSSTPFVVTADDCSHAGNRDVGRDRVFVMWDGTNSTQTDHLDIRYCD